MTNELNKELSDAVASRDFTAITKLLDQGADVNFQNESGIDMLMYACLWGDVEMAEFSLKHGADINAKNKTNGTTVLKYAQNACHRSNTESNTKILRLLLDRGAKD